MTHDEVSSICTGDSVLTYVSHVTQGYNKGTNTFTDSNITQHDQREQANATWVSLLSLELHHAAMKCHKIDVYVWGFMVIIPCLHEVLLINKLDASQVASMTIVQGDIEPANKQCGW